MTEDLDLYKMRELILNRPEATNSMSNFDHLVDGGMEEELMLGRRSVHSAWNFNGIVWYDSPRYCEIVQRYHEPVDYIVASDLQALMESVNDKWGWE
jgi:hypothetical protein